LVELAGLTRRTFMMGREVDLMRDSLYSTYTPRFGHTVAVFIYRRNIRCLSIYFRKPDAFYVCISHEIYATS